MKKGKILKTIRSKRGKVVSLEPFSFNRCKEFYQLYLASKPEWEKFLVLHFSNLDDAKNFIAQQYNNDKFTGYFVVNNETRKLLGFIIGDELNSCSIIRTRATGSAYKHQGYGYEATQLFEAIMRKAGYESVILYVDAENKLSRELLQRDGYQYEKTEHLSIGFVFTDLLVYSKKLIKTPALI